MMRLGLSSAAAPDASLEELLAACSQRGLSALELREGDAHRVRSADDTGARESPTARARAAGVVIAGYRTAVPGADLRLARLAVALDAPLLVANPGGVRARLDRAAGLAAVSAAPVVVVRGETALSDAELVAGEGLDLAWDADPNRAPLGTHTGELLDRFGARLRHIQVRGGGPEAAMQEGRGVGELMGRLALAGYQGAVVLSPSSSQYRVAWESWLGRRGGWGCGSRTSDSTLVHLAGAATVAGGSS